MGTAGGNEISSQDGLKKGSEDRLACGLKAISAVGEGTGAGIMMLFRSLSDSECVGQLGHHQWHEFKQLKSVPAIRSPHLLPF